MHIFWLSKIINLSFNDEIYNMIKILLSLGIFKLNILLK